ncbi:putative MFS family arabinose efflux permease [Rhodopseudomonas thermotolerans]|uniref:MFS family arabinose efflux permease n=2 Tax=Rhodopseudomonas TaxID=1073 RepID=A0A336JRA9_9BRAD|nr:MULTISPECIES: MFS transporter [Rhodopseudomonas]RED29711.1 putative MFS family arabinose efflux permease [Rhodopseudomonas pentothenatexigens]REF92472.1 putative MFS family arabinose efflux permease [Rhodopseudomonas thermotolerans]SSW92317.1 predicted MFS family arabinose efflux permease [Rhodopseudomonas pentothenatexigens]
MKAAQLSPFQRWSILIGASVLLSLAMGMRQSFGLFQPSVIRDVGITSADFSFATALQNIIWGVTQPMVGLLADRYGTRWVMLGGVVVYAAGLVLMMVADSALMFTLGCGVCVGIALSCTASSMTMTVTSRTVSPAKRSVAMGAVSAAGSLGLVLASPLAQTLISTAGWQMALIGFLGLAAAMLPSALFAGRADKLEIEKADDVKQSAGEVVQAALGHSGFVVMAIAFFVCGLQLVFITTHLPNYLAICGLDPSLGASALAVIGLFNVFGSYAFGWLGGKFPKQYLLGGIYIVRSLTVAAYFYFPASAGSTLVFAAIMGSLWLGVIPLVNGLVAQLFGLRYMATLTGIAFLSHQVGSFLGAWGGGVIYDHLGNYDRAWQAAVLIGLIAGCAQMLMNVQPPRKRDELVVPATA